MKEWIGDIAAVISEHVLLGYIWELCLSASAMILFLLLIRPLMKRLPRIAMYLLWILVVVRMVCPFSVSGIYGLFPEYVGKTVAQTRHSVMPETISSRLTHTVAEEHIGGIKNSYRLKPEGSKMGSPGNANESVSVPKGMEKNTAGKTADAVVQAGQQAEKSSVDYSQENGHIFVDVEGEEKDWTAVVIIAVWLTGVLFCVLYLICSLLMNRKMFRHAMHLFNNVYEHPYACSSFVGGIISPKIYVPKGIRGEDMECILLHEKTHIRRQDYRIKPLAFLVFSLLWFNPLVWAAYRLMMRDMEISCDEMVVRKLGSSARKRYSYLLLAMASGENGILCPNTAFGAGAVNERIHTVMKYKKPTKIVTMLAALAVVLCGCGISSTPDAGEAGTGSTTIPQEKEAVYVEQTVPAIEENWNKYVPEGGEAMVGVIANALDAQGNMFSFCEVDTEESGYICMVKALLQDGEWQTEEVKWDKKVLGKKKNAEISDVFYGADGFLYVAVGQMSMSEQEFFKKSEKAQEQNVDDYYLIKQFLYRINEETGEYTELNVPQTPMKEAMDTDQEGILTNSYGIFADGNYIAFDGRWVYNGVTGEKMEVWSPDHKQSIGMILTGDDFICWWEHNQQTKQIEVHVCDETLKETYVFDTGVEYSGGEKRPYITLGAKGSTILMATEEGIFEAEYGEDEFHHVAGYETDNLYYLAPGNYEPISRMFKGEEQDYYLYVENSNTGEGMWCYYSNKREKTSEAEKNKKSEAEKNKKGGIENERQYVIRK